MGSLLRDTGRPQEAEAAYRRALTIYEQEVAKSPRVLEHREVLASVYRELASLLIGTPGASGVRDPGQAVELARRAVELDPEGSSSWNTLGAAQYRAGDWKAARRALEKSVQLSQGGDSFDWFLMAMAHWQLGDRELARRFYDQAVERVEKHQPQSEELHRFRAEAAELLGIAAK